MKKIISILLAVMLVVMVTVVSAGAYNSDGDYTKMNTGGSTYKPSDSYTVDDKTPTCEEAIKACGGSIARDDVQYVYFQLPTEDPNQKGSDWVNKYNTDANGVCQVCVYWWAGTGSDWSAYGGGKVAWTGFRATLVDAENRIYRAVISNDGNTPLMIWNNGVNGGMDPEKPIFNYARQLGDANIEGAYEGDYDTLPEGTPNEENMDNCIAIIDYDESKMVINPLTGFPNYGYNWYVYYGNGCYGYYPETSENFHGRITSCVNPEHHHTLPGDVNNDKVVDVLDVLCIQYYLAGVDLPEGMEFHEDTADVDGDGYISIIDATRIQRYLAKICNLDGSKPYKAES